MVQTPLLKARPAPGSVPTVGMYESPGAYVAGSRDRSSGIEGRIVSSDTGGRDGESLADHAYSFLDLLRHQPEGCRKFIGRSNPFGI